MWRRPHKVQEQRMCIIYGCQEKMWLYGRCKPHFRGLDPQLYEKLKSMTRAERQIEFEKTISEPPFREPWTFEGDEEKLAEMTEKQEIEHE
jgi:hypothetical protein